MSVSPEIVDKAVKELIQNTQSAADKARNADSVLQWTEIPLTATPEDIANLIIALQTGRTQEMAAPEDLMANLQTYMQKLQTTDPEALQETMQLAQQMMMTPSIQKGGLMLKSHIAKPENGATEWTLVVVPLFVDENYQVAVADKLDYDLYLNAYVAPVENSALTDTFNSLAPCMLAGQQAKPLAISYTPDSDGQKVFRVSGHIQKDGQVQPVEVSIPFTVGDTTPEIPRRTCGNEPTTGSDECNGGECDGGSCADGPCDGPPCDGPCGSGPAPS